MVLKGFDQWESAMPPVGVNTQFTTSEIAEWNEIAWVALKQNGRAT